MGALVVVTTVGTEEEANQLAEELVARRHSSCVNIIPVHRSVYRWKGKVCDDREFLLVIKTLEAEYEAVEATIQELHSYELPEILAFQVSRGEARFLDCDLRDARLRGLVGYARATWIEANIPYYGTYEHTRPGTSGSRDAWHGAWSVQLAEAFQSPDPSGSHVNVVAGGTKVGAYAPGSNRK